MEQVHITCKVVAFSLFVLTFLLLLFHEGGDKEEAASPAAAAPTYAVKACLQCEASMCPEHVRPQLEFLAFREHPLTDVTRVALNSVMLVCRHLKLIWNVFVFLFFFLLSRSSPKYRGGGAAGRGGG